MPFANLKRELNVNKPADSVHRRTRKHPNTHKSIELIFEIDAENTKRKKNFYIFNYFAFFTSLKLKRSCGIFEFLCIYSFFLSYLSHLFVNFRWSLRQVFKWAQRNNIKCNLFWGFEIKIRFRFLIWFNCENLNFYLNQEAFEMFKHSAMLEVL